MFIFVVSKVDEGCEGSGKCIQPYFHKLSFISNRQLFIVSGQTAAAAKVASAAATYDENVK